ncbi:hypothetical protein [Vogesella sp. AC12]|uniref:hypothetical protein n=1 Tax=Vogesella sp. AC12 TaxID=2950550 RepID=UPI0021094623|nr:hypothetical protein [Vogesella sp. AC12]MCQ4145397.1 hypothetical protein [Vogesella sp. AC12]
MSDDGCSVAQKGWPQAGDGLRPTFVFIRSERWASGWADSPDAPAAYPGYVKPDLPRQTRQPAPSRGAPLPLVPAVKTAAGPETSRPLSAQRMGGAGQVTVFAGIPAPSGRLFFASFLFGEAKEREPLPRGKRQIKTSAQRIPQVETRLAANPWWLAANLCHSSSVNVGLRCAQPNLRADLCHGSTREDTDKGKSGFGCETRDKE